MGCFSLQTNYLKTLYFNYSWTTLLLVKQIFMNSIYIEQSNSATTAASFQDTLMLTSTDVYPTAFDTILLHYIKVMPTELHL